MKSTLPFLLWSSRYMKIATVESYVLDLSLEWVEHMYSSKYHGKFFSHKLKQYEVNLNNTHPTHSIKELPDIENFYIFKAI